VETTLVVNGIERTVRLGAGWSLLEVLRDEIGVTGPKFGCGEGACGACTVLVGRRAVTACTTPVAEVAGQRITTVEGLAEDGLLHPVQQAWLEAGAMQCGYCTPGWLMATAALLVRVPHPDDARIAAELAGNVCRCCTYPRILRAVRRAAELMEEPEQLQPVPPPVAQQVPAAPSLPWDSSAKDENAFFASLPDGLVTVVAADDPGAGRPASRPGPGSWGRPDDAWVHVGADGAVTAFSGKVEAGQGTRTALALLVAEELAIPAGSVRLVMGNTDVSPFDVGTFGSRSMPYAAPPVRAAAAAARDLLREAAAERFGLPAASLTVADGLVAGPDGAPSISMGELLTGIRRVARVPPDRPVSPPATWRSAGHPARALGAAEVVTGGKRFPADISLDGMLHGCVLRAPGYGAVLRTADTAAAEALPGVIMVREDDFIAAAAPDRATALRAIGAIRAEWDRSPQPSRADLADYLRSHPVNGEGWSGPFRHEAGDVDAALAAAPVRLQASYSAAYIAHVPLEPRSALAHWQDGHLTVWTGTSTPFRARRELAEALGLPETAVRVVVPDYGGGFGGKHGSTVAAEAARLARAADCPVRVQWSRHEEFHWGYLRPAALIDVASSASGTGEISGWSFTNINSGSVGILSPYRIPHQRIVYQPADSPLPQGSYRALAATANHFARESHMDELAAQLGTDPLEFRLRHLDDNRLADVFRAAAERLGWRPGARPAGRQPGAGTGIGIAGGIEKGGRVATAAEVRVEPGGTLRVLRLVSAFDCGAVVNPDNLANQIEGAAMMGLGGALFEQIDFADGVIRNASLSAYRVPRLPDLPEVEVVLLDRPDEPSAGGGETPIVAVAPAIANAVFDACGARLRSMPLAPDGVVAGVGSG
jgi:CO/xanthine dehydrogenase Mo-binding subunit/aerobic-type carbon monoxide dehydrogenase small subunit (CoxS/CutS family)